MSIEVKNRRGTTAEHVNFTGAIGEITVDTDKKVVVVHDGATAGGNPQDNAERIKSKAVTIDDFTGKDGYVMAYDETNDQFILKKDEGGGGGGFTGTFVMSSLTFGSFVIGLTSTAIPKPA